MKTKNPYITIVAIFIVAIMVYSCRKDFISDELQANPKAAWAESYFKQTLLPDEGNSVDPYQYVGNILQANLMSKKKENHKIPIWQKAMEGKTSDYDFVEVPLKYTTKVTPMLYQSSSNNSKTVDKAILQASLDRLIIFKKRNGDIDQRIVTFVPTKAYLDRHNGDISNNKINKLDKDFDGVLIYRKWNGAFESALIVNNGKGIKRLLLNKPTSKFKKARFQNDDCGTFEVWEWFVVCSYDGDDPTPRNCGEPYREKVGEYTIECDDDPPYDPCLEPENVEICNGGGEGGGGTEPDPEEDVVDWGDVTDESSFTPIDTAALDLANDTEVSKAFNWAVYTAPGGIAFTAKQKLYCKKKAIVFWVVDHLDNEGIVSSGASTDSKGRTVSAEVVSWTDQSTARWAKGKLKFKDIRTKMKADGPKVQDREFTEEGGWETHKIFN